MYSSVLQKIGMILFGSLSTCLTLCFVYSIITIIIWFMYTDSVFRPLTDYELYVIQNLGDHGLSSNLLMTRRDILDAEIKFDKYEYNAWLSERISLKRPLGDFRDTDCLTINYTLPKNVSVSIIIAHNLEHPQTLLRTLYSIQRETSSRILREIIIVNDGPSDIELHKYISANFQKVKQIEYKKEKGLIYARITGAKRAKGDVLVFLNAHIEVTKGWLPPLLEPLIKNKKTVTEPVLDTISTENFGYERSEFHDQMGFNWLLERLWFPLDNASISKLPDPYPTPSLEGFAFAIDRKWFWHLGAWDEGFRGNGGDALELSLKAWQCGGRILTATCSRIGFIYKKSEVEVQQAPNKNANKVTRKNFKRVIEVWFDEFKFSVYRLAPRLRNISSGGLIKQRNLRRRLNCKSFAWYRSQVALASNSFLRGGLKRLAFGKISPFVAPIFCLSVRGSQLILKKCNTTVLENWTLTYRCQLKLGVMCLEVGPNSRIRASKCINKFFDHHWQYSFQDKAFITDNQKCLHIDFQKRKLVLRPCNSSLTEQRWLYTGITDASQDNVLKMCLELKH
ncbi:putative polypeptide N-acetylgalactosaminyltransferase 11 [Drosophila ananassae]|uniref:putative polypeptide N-acetylgalactosaminyltransferase 11 n=1 Tax=Drosophila ananassae TaxID=7217 RepID=UPI001CFF7CB5|nr:putative polypeptide N-acetylgalactosaminyltransferase 11 [Drosophila ananassae]